MSKRELAQVFTEYPVTASKASHHRDSHDHLWQCLFGSGFAYKFLLFFLDCDVPTSHPEPPCVCDSCTASGTFRAESRTRGYHNRRQGRSEARWHLSTFWIYWIQDGEAGTNREGMVSSNLHRLDENQSRCHRGEQLCFERKYLFNVLQIGSQRCSCTSAE